MRQSLAAIILTYNEEANLDRCLESIKGLADEIFVVDSHSKDRTREIAENFGAKVYEHDFRNQAEQFNWALDNLNIKSDWILRLDADEHLLPELAKEISETLAGSGISINQRTDQHESAINGFYLKRRMYFMGRWMRHGGYYPTWILRLWRKGKGRIDNREMDEHTIVSEGRVENLKNDFVDDNKNGLSAWIEKHNGYALREAAEAIRGEYGRGGKRSFYYKMPMFLRALIYFKYRYFLRLGFLDGIPGLIFHVLHGFWYRFLVDAKIYESSKK